MGIGSFMEAFALYFAWESAFRHISVEVLLYLSCSFNEGIGDCRWVRDHNDVVLSNSTVDFSRGSLL